MVPLYKVEARVSDGRISIVTKKAKEVFGTDFRVEKIDTSPSRAMRLAEAEDHWSQAQSILQELVEEVESWFGNMPEPLQGSDKGQAVEAAKDALQEILDNLEQCDFSGVEFPGMYG